jgi:hypothetical protein
MSSHQLASPFYSLKRLVLNSHYRRPPALPDRLPDPIKGRHTPGHLHRAHPLSPLFTSSPEHFDTDRLCWVPLSTAASPPHHLSAPGVPVGRFPAPPSCSLCHHGKELIPAAPTSSYSGELRSLPCPWPTMDRGAASPPPRAPGPPIYPLKNNSILSLI